MSNIEKIEEIIYEVDGELVMLSSDLAKLYHSKNGTKEINQAVTRNQNKFTENDTWILEKDEIDSLLVTGSDQKVETRGGKFSRPRVFTKSGIKILSGILRGKNKEQTTEEILTAFSKKYETRIENKNALIPSNNNEYIKNMIYEVNGIEVIIDSDLAKLFKCKNGTKEINQAVKNNLKKFPERYSWILSDEELSDLRSKFLTANYSNMSRTNPRVFTETGVAMLATILKTELAIEMSIKIIDAFVAMRKYISNDLIEQKYINNLVLKDSKRIDLIEDALSEFKEKNNHIFFKGQIYDSYSLLMNILEKSKDNIIIIDNYIDKNLLDIFSSIDRKITLITNKYNNNDYNKYISQYDNIKLEINNDVHDRFIIIDNKTLYHSGASFKDLGKKCFAINKIEDENILNGLICRIAE